mgnify:CR=1
MVIMLSSIKSIFLEKSKFLISGLCVCVFTEDIQSSMLDNPLT